MFDALAKYTLWYVCVPTMDKVPLWRLARFLDIGVISDTANIAVLTERGQEVVAYNVAPALLHVRNPGEAYPGARTAMVMGQTRLQAAYEDYWAAHQDNEAAYDAVHGGMGSNV